MHDLLFQKVFLVEEEDDGGFLEPGVGDDGVEQMGESNFTDTRTNAKCTFGERT